MPFYDYRCPDCGYSLTLRRKIVDSYRLPYCNICKKEMKKLLSAVPIVYKANGFYTPKSED